MCTIHLTNLRIYASVCIRVQSPVRRFDARPSDSAALADKSGNGSSMFEDGAARGDEAQEV